MVKILKKFFEFFRIFFRKKDFCDHVVLDKWLIFGYVIRKPYTSRFVQ